MTLFEITGRFGASSLMRVLVLLLGFLLLHALREPLRAAVRLLTVVMTAVDRMVSLRLANSLTDPGPTEPKGDRR